MNDSLLKLLPENLLQDANVEMAAKAIDKELNLLVEDIGRLSRFSRMDELTSEEIDELAWESHVDFYDPSLLLEQRRRLVKNAVAWHKRKGTPGAVEEIVKTLFDGGKVKEWFEYGGEPFHFKIITREILLPEKRDKIMEIVDSLKNVRSRLETIETIRDYTRKIEIHANYNACLHNFPLAGALDCGIWPTADTSGTAVQCNITITSACQVGDQSYRLAGIHVCGTISSGRGGIT